MATEGSMDSSLLNGNSVQRTVNGVMVVNGDNRKIVGRLPDGGQFDNSIKGVSTGIYILINSTYVDYQVGGGLVFYTIDLISYIYIVCFYFFFTIFLYFLRFVETLLLQTLAKKVLRVLLVEK
jgi:hypothetical protein